MPHSRKSSLHPVGRAVLLSVKPKYANLILGGTKRVEFRRSWAVEDVSEIVIYASSPIQKIVALVEIDDVVVASPSALWQTCKERGGGLTRRELRAYFSGKPKGVAVLLGRTLVAVKDIDPSKVIGNFVAPQSFRYLNDSEHKKIKGMICAREAI